MLTYAVDGSMRMSILSASSTRVKHKASTFFIKTIDYLFV
jgi:hypothetical protein